MNTEDPKIPVHPGVVLNEEFIKKTGLTPNKLAAKLGVEAKLIKDIVNEKKGISEELAAQLTRLFSTPAQYWTRLQSDYSEGLKEYVRVMSERPMHVSFRHLLNLDDFTPELLETFFADVVDYEKGRGPTHDGAVAMFFPPTSLRTRLTFERAAHKMGLQPIVFPSETLEKGEDLKDVASYLAQWADIAVVRHPDSDIVYGLAENDALPVINAMTDIDHPCEVLSDLYGLSETQGWHGQRYLFVGPDGNMARAWFYASETLGFHFTQCCPDDLRVHGAAWDTDLESAIQKADIVITDNPGEYAERMRDYQVTAELLDKAPEDVQFLPCPPFERGRELSADALEHPAFVGYEFKRHLLPVHQAILARAMGN